MDGLWPHDMCIAAALSVRREDGLLKHSMGVIETDGAEGREKERRWLIWCTIRLSMAFGSISFYLETHPSISWRCTVLKVFCEMPFVTTGDIGII